MGAWPCGTIVLVNELFGSESLSQVYGNIHTFLQENKGAAKNLGMLNMFSILERFIFSFRIPSL